VAGNGVTSIVSSFLMRHRPRLTRGRPNAKVHHRYHKSASTATFMLSEQAVVISEDSAEEHQPVFRVDKFGSTESLLGKLKNSCKSFSGSSQSDDRSKSQEKSRVFGRQGYIH